MLVLPTMQDIIFSDTQLISLSTTSQVFDTKQLTNQLIFDKIVSVTLRVSDFLGDYAGDTTFPRVLGVGVLRSSKSFSGVPNFLGGGGGAQFPRTLEWGCRLSWDAKYRVTQVLLYTTIFYHTSADSMSACKRYRNRLSKMA